MTRFIPLCIVLFFALAGVAAADNGDTPLHEAAKKNDYEKASLLIEQGAEVNATDDSGRTPLHFTVLRNARETAALLIEHGAYVNATDNGGGNAVVLGDVGKHPQDSGPVD